MVRTFTLQDPSQLGLWGLGWDPVESQSKPLLKVYNYENNKF